MNNIIFYQVESCSHTVDNLVDSFYPEFACDERKRPAIKAAIQAMNRHLGMSQFGSLSHLSWVVMPDYNSSAYRQIDRDVNPDPFSVSCSAQHQLVDVPNMWKPEIHQAKVIPFNGQYAMNITVHERVILCLVKNLLKINILRNLGRRS